MSDNNSKQTIPERLQTFNNDLHKYLTEDKNLKNYLDNKNELSYEIMMELKSRLHDVNNIVTLLTTIQFAKHFGIDTDKIDNNPNATGYDFVYDDNNIVIVAEVKCNIPCSINKDGLRKYGSRQQEEIIKDLQGLINEKNKSQLKKEKTSRFPEAKKFLVVLAEDINNARDAMQSLINSIDGCVKKEDAKGLSKAKNDIKTKLNELNIEKLSDIVKEYDIETQNNTIETIKGLYNNKVYVVYITPNNKLISEFLNKDKQ